MSSNRSRYEPLPTDDVPDSSASGGSTTLDDPLGGNEGSKRGLQQRHLSMMALAGMIGTGLFLSSGKALAHAGPLGSVLAFVIMGTVTASIAFISAEMSAVKPVEGGFVRHATLWLDRSTGITVGWNFWYSMAITMPTEISAAASLLEFWDPNVQLFFPIRYNSLTGQFLLGLDFSDTDHFSIFWFIIVVINFSPVRVYGEFEFYLAFMKIALIIFFIIGGLLLDLGFLPGRDRIGFRYWSDPYPTFREYVVTGLQGRFLGFCSAMISAAFAYGNVQVVAMAGAETRNPRKTIPMALKKTFTRVIIFYVVSIFVISLTIPADDERLYFPSGDVSRSPFVIAFSGLGSKTLPSAVNAIVLSSAFSSGNACSFLASRTLHGLALDGHAPSIFLKQNRFGTPYVAVAASVTFGAISYTSLNQGAFQAFLWLVSLVTTAGILSWIIICLTYLRFFHSFKAQNISRKILPYRSPFQPYITYYALIMNIFVLIFSGWNSFIPVFDLSLFVSNYINCILYPFLYFSCKHYFGDTMIGLDTMDIRLELALIDAEQEHEDFIDRPKLSLYDKVLNSFF
ncbi:amino acid permease [Gymnopilus junonius]|uniref:Amino acid permease n=1 Tax=Gymnopilus junonius TaxID=109634 RepID=A0A9P5TQ00_GYMJU|nr:amino acid permease [Gymnopilus junonius]